MKIIIVGIIAVSVFLVSCDDSGGCPEGMHEVDSGNGSTICVPN